MHQAIMSTPHPSKQKEFGRKIRNFDKEKWEAVAIDIVTRGNYAKFTQNEEFKQYLMDTGDKLIVEASPLDPIWGIGLAEADEDCLDTDKWKGTNWLGIAIMNARKQIREENANV
jgi:ribA/ribD-fused uncharacterized protein